MPVLLSVENLVPLKPVLGGVRDVALFHYLSFTDSVKLSLQFSWHFAVLTFPRDHFLPDIISLYLHETLNTK
jgi:hypothetical protein